MSFKNGEIYEEAYGICLNEERVMDMFSKELYEMQQQGIRSAMVLLRDLKVPEQEIKTRICEQYQISVEQMQALLD